MPDSRKNMVNARKNAVRFPDGILLFNNHGLTLPSNSKNSFNLKKWGGGGAVFFAVNGAKNPSA
jgi:hypothetical protein